METQQKTALILGATGLTGNLLLQLLLKDSRYKKIKLFSRSTVGVAHPKIEAHLGDLVQLDHLKRIFLVITFSVALVRQGQKRQIKKNIGKLTLVYQLQLQNYVRKMESIL